MASCWRFAGRPSISTPSSSRIREALEETKAHGLRFKPTKTKSGRRDIELPDIVVEALRDHRRQQLEQRVAMGLGKLADDALVFLPSTAARSHPAP